jgi:hypothetical protein
MGRPDYLQAREVEELITASELDQVPLPYKYRDHSIRMQVSLAPQSVTAIDVHLSQVTAASNECSRRI